MERDFIKHYKQVDDDRKKDQQEQHRAWNVQMRSDLIEAIPQLFEAYCTQPPSTYLWIEKDGEQTIGWELYHVHNPAEVSYDLICLLADGSLAEVRSPLTEQKSKSFFLREIRIEEIPDTPLWGSSEWVRNEPSHKDARMISSLHRAVIDKVYSATLSDAVRLRWSDQHYDYNRD